MRVVKTGADIIPTDAHQASDGRPMHTVSSLDSRRADQIRSSILSDSYNSLEMADQIARAVIRSGDL